MTKHTILYGLLFFLCMCAGICFGLLDLFGFLDGRHDISISLLVSGLGIVYLLTICIFLVSYLKDMQRSIIFGISVVLFAIPFFLMNLNIILSVISSLAFLGFIIFSFSESRKRADLFVKFTPTQLFFPVLKQSFIYIMIILAVTAYVQSQRKIETNTLITPTTVMIIGRPSIYILNTQLSNQLEKQLGARFEKTIGTRDREKIIKFVLSETIESMSEGTTRQFFGFRPDTIPVDKTIVYPNGDIDVTPVVRAMAPQISQKLNIQLQKYAFFAPFAIGLLVLLILQAVLVPFQIIESILTVCLFKVLLATKFIQKKTETREVEVIEI